MRKEDKSTIIEQIAATVKEYGHFYLVDTTAMNAADTSALWFSERYNCRNVQQRC